MCGPDSSPTAQWPTTLLQFLVCHFCTPQSMPTTWKIIVHFYPKPTPRQTQPTRIQLMVGWVQQTDPQTIVLTGVLPSSYLQQRFWTPKPAAHIVCCVLLCTHGDGSGSGSESAPHSTSGSWLLLRAMKGTCGGRSGQDGSYSGSTLSKNCSKVKSVQKRVENVLNHTQTDSLEKSFEIDFSWGSFTLIYFVHFSELFIIIAWLTHFWAIFIQP